MAVLIVPLVCVDRTCSYWASPSKQFRPARPAKRHGALLLFVRVLVDVARGIFRVTIGNEGPITVFDDIAKFRKLKDAKSWNL